MHMKSKHLTETFSKRGFTLIEVMVTVAILAFGIVSIYQALFVSVDAYGYYTHYFSTQDWISEKIWEVQEELTDSNMLEVTRTSGQFVRTHKTFDWIMVVSLLDADEGLYKVNVTLTWREGDKMASTSREAYLLSPKLKIYNEESAV